MPTSLTEPTRIVFIDIDGTLMHDYEASYRAYREGHWENLKQTLSELRGDEELLHVNLGDLAAVRYDWQKEPIRQLERILCETDAMLVVHSSWRLYNTPQRLKSLFALHGLGGYVVDMTPAQPYEKESSIRAWLAENKQNVIQYVVLDDRKLSLPAEHLVKIKPSKLLTSQDADTAIAILTAGEMSGD